MSLPDSYGQHRSVMEEDQRYAHLQDEWDTLLDEQEARDRKDEHAGHDRARYLPTLATGWKPR